MQFIKYDAFLSTSDSINRMVDTIVVEAPLQISINDSPYTVVMRSPGDDINLIRGLLYAEDIYKSANKLTYTIDESNVLGTLINITIPLEELRDGYLNKRTLLSVSSCGICGKKELKNLRVSGTKISNTFNISLPMVPKLFTLMLSKQQLFKETGGSHAAGIFDTNYKLLSTKEDIGRHNAVDKTVGDLLEKGILKKATILLVSGRVSYEIITKAFLAKINVVIAVSACSSLAIDYAKEFNICLIGFSRANKGTIYNQPKNITIIDEKDYCTRP